MIIESPNIFLLPGFDGTGELFAPLQSALGKDIQAVVIHYRDEFLFEDYIDSVTSLLPPKNVILIAESFSGPIALALMARYPSRIRCCVLCSTFAVSPFHNLTRLARFVPTRFFGANPAQRAMLKIFCFDKESDPALLTKALSVIRSVPARTIKSRLNVLANLDMRPLLSRITIPILYLQAMQDKIVSPQLSRELVNGLPNVIVRKLNGPHLLLQTRAEDCAEVIMPFIINNNSVK